MSPESREVAHLLNPTQAEDSPVTTHINGIIETETIDHDHHRTVFEWIAPTPDQDPAAFLLAATTRFAEELHNQLQAHEGNVTS